MILKNLLIILIVLVTINLNLIIEASEINVAQAIENVTNSCDKKLDFKSIKEFQAFIRDLRELDKNKKLPLDSSSLLVKKCFDDKESLYELDELIKNFDKKRACKFNEITKLENYAKKYFSKKDKTINNKNRSLAIKFFTLFGVNLGFICKFNLLAHIKQADLEVEQLDFIYSMASPTGWNVLINEHTKKSMKFGVSGQANNVINRVAKLIPGLNQVEQLNYLDFNHSLNFKNDKNSVFINGDKNEFGEVKILDKELSKKVKEFLDKIIDSCKNLDKFYYNLLLSLAKLNHLGLVVNFEILNQYHENSLPLHKWLAATSFCQLLIRVKTLPFNDIDDDSIKFEVIHNDKLLESRRKLYSYVDELNPDENDIDKQALDHVWLASVIEGNWNQEKEAMFKQDFKDGSVSLAQEQVSQFIRGLERDYKQSIQNEQ